MLKEFRQRTADGQKGPSIYIDNGHVSAVKAVQVGTNFHADVYTCGGCQVHEVWEDATTVNQHLGIKR